MSAPYTLILLRHGQSEWNKSNQFTGWVDVRLTDQGKAEATRGGELMKEAGLLPDLVHTSLQSRAIQTANLAANLKRLRIWDAQGDLVNLTGPQLRALHILESGRDSISDAADVPISSTATSRTIYWVIDFAPRFRARECASSVLAQS